MLALMDSQELTGWLVLGHVLDDERATAEEHAKHVADSDDGTVVYHGRPEDDDEEDDEVDPDHGPSE